eukprot:COSAG03_NODE_12873_length_527_cov_0.955607_2_plen_85_part_01
MSAGGERGSRCSNFVRVRAGRVLMLPFAKQWKPLHVFLVTGPLRCSHPAGNARTGDGLNGQSLAASLPMVAATLYALKDFEFTEK